MSANERSGWRDRHLSARHRRWGYDVPFVDGDFLAVEYDNAKAALIVDYKLHLASIRESANTEALGELYTKDGVQLPFFVVRYWGTPDCPEVSCPCRGDLKNIWSFAVHPMNDLAKKRLTGNVAMSEQAYVAWLFEMRGRRASPNTLRSLSTMLPPVTYHMGRRWKEQTRNEAT